MTDERARMSVVVANDRQPEESTRWLALVLAEMFRTGLALIAKRYPEARGAARCPRCGHRHS